MTNLPALVRETRPDGHADAAVIWLHGLGADGSDFVPIVPELRLPSDMAVRFIFPNAPSIPVSINQGYVMPAWYDILEMDVSRRVDETQLRASAAAVHELVEAQMAAGIDSRRIILAGFSQGGAVVLEAGLSCPHPLAGIMSLSSYFPTADTVTVNQANRELPIRVFHGTADPVVREALGQQAVAALQAKGYKPEYSSYPMQHTVCLEEIRDISSWLQSTLNTRSA
ncbi:alpha/beta hydrolase [Pseudohongiella sp. O18]|uniref:alpha/beta hydrolase n=1 Tax=Pseudohongiella sp. O18 TaxID=2904248 RepID=UPI000C45E4A3|nr:alpha/beta hydrolase [Pseudohongiella sp. O18]MAY56875.1 carboxylesterase [Gammaproteobacteria bacterium]MBJ56500.1 carboxylesterase [Gammaproteobacteria bacterium]|tara:strand:+ start:1075 stop:1752 length:678 start_codon:yes stop_codon:yes gene_type:complete